MQNDSTVKRPPKNYARATVSEGRNAIYIKYDDEPDEIVYYRLKENECRAIISESTRCIDISDENYENHTYYSYINDEEKEYLRDRYQLGAISVQHQLTSFLLAPFSALGLGFIIRWSKSAHFGETSNIPHVLLMLVVYIFAVALSIVFTSVVPAFVVDAFALDRAYRDKKWKPQILSSLVSFVSTLIFLWVVLFKFL